MLDGASREGAAGSNPSIEYASDTVGKTPADASYPFATYRMDQFPTPIWLRDSRR